MVEQSARRGDDDVHPAFQRIELLGVAHTAVNHRHGEVGEARVIANGRLHLAGQLACRLHDEHAGFSVLFSKLRKERQSEGAGLARARLRAANDIAPFEQQRDGAQLDGRRVHPPHCLDPLEDRLR